MIEGDVETTARRRIEETVEAGNFHMKQDRSKSHTLGDTGVVEQRAGGASVATWVQIKSKVHTVTARTKYHPLGDTCHLSRACTVALWAVRRVDSARV